MASVVLQRRADRARIVVKADIGEFDHDGVQTPMLAVLYSKAGDLPWRALADTGAGCYRELAGV